MTVVAIDTQQRPIPDELEREILARIDRGVQICEADHGNSRLMSLWG